MLLNYIKLSIRLLARRPFFTFINISGLSVGFAVFFILWQHSTYELKSDQFPRIMTGYIERIAISILVRETIGITISTVQFRQCWQKWLKKKTKKLKVLRALYTKEILTQSDGPDLRPILRVGLGLVQT